MIKNNQRVRIIDSNVCAACSSRAKSWWVRTNIIPRELENVISELFGALVKLLYNSRDSRTEEIVEVMISYSASAGSLSDTKIQSRREEADEVVARRLEETWRREI